MIYEHPARYILRLMMEILRCDVETIRAQIIARMFIASLEIAEYVFIPRFDPAQLRLNI